LYAGLRRIAGARLAAESPGQTLVGGPADGHVRQPDRHGSPHPAARRRHGHRREVQADRGDRRGRDGHGVDGEATAERERDDARRERDRAARAAAAEREAKQAEGRQRKTTDDVLQFFVKRVIAAARPKVSGGLGRNVTVLAAPEAAEKEIETSFAGRPEIEGRLRLSLGGTYTALGLRDRAEAQYRRAAEVFAALRDLRGGESATLALLLLREQRLTEVQFADARDRAAGLIDEAVLAKGVADGRKTPNFVHARNLIRLAQVRLMTGSLREAEADFRECLDVLRRIERDHGWVWLAKALLGECLTKQNRYTEAEEVLLACYADMKQREASVPPEERDVIPEAVDRLVELYDAWSKPAEAARWRAERARYPFVAPPPRAAKQ
jgi:tetratricopeptide (TPR) repeat protein